MQVAARYDVDPEVQDYQSRRPVQALHLNNPSRIHPKTQPSKPPVHPFKSSNPTNILNMKFSWDSASQTPRVVVTAEDPEFDRTTLQNWAAEGFEVSYLPFTTSRKAYIQQFQDLAESLELGEKYAIVGQAIQQRPMPSFLSTQPARLAKLIRDRNAQHMAKPPK